MKILLFVFSSFIFHFIAQAQPSSDSIQNNDLYFVSDTQQPMLVERLVLKSNHNIKATNGIFADIIKNKPRSVYMLGDLVALGFANRKWKRADQFINSCRSAGTNVCAVLGNHEVMGKRVKGEANFQKRFPMNVRTGYVSVTDSVAVVLLNSNFATLTSAEEKMQQDWYAQTMYSLDTTNCIKAIIVSCHHAPYSNSTIVRPNRTVQEQFVPAYLQSKKAQLFITGHAHAFERFNIKGKEFLVIGGGGGLHQPLRNGGDILTDLAASYKPMFHYLSVRRINNNLLVQSHFLKNDFKGFEPGISFHTQLNTGNYAAQLPQPATKSAN